MQALNVKHNVSRPVGEWGVCGFFFFWSFLGMVQGNHTERDCALKIYEIAAYKISQLWLSLVFIWLAAVLFHAVLPHQIPLQTLVNVSL